LHLTPTPSLTDSDRSLLTTAASTLSTHALIGSLAGLTLGAYLAFRLRSNRAALFAAFRATERPTHVKFASGREEAIPDLAPLLKPTTLGDIATYTFFAAGGVFVGGETGVVTGAWRAKAGITGDVEARERIEKAFRSFKADVLRRQIEELEKGKGEPMLS
jgi:hypothetical protein